MNIPSPRAKRRARIEIVPLIDIIFFLLATFVMVSLSMVKNKGIPVNLPVASSGEAQDRQEFVSITVTEDGALFYNKEATTIEELPNLIASLKSSVQDPRVFINGDEKADLGRAIAVLDELRRGGITKVAIETKPRQKV